MSNEYPHMLYVDGDASKDWKIVEDADAETEAGKEGFVRYGKGKKAAKQEGEPAPKAPAKKAAK